MFDAYPPSRIGSCRSCAVVVGVTGSYAGTGIQYVVPAALVYFARKVRRLASNFFKDFLI